MLLKEYQVKVETTIMHYERAHDTYAYKEPLAITEDFSQYRYAMVLVIKEYLDRYFFGSTDVLSIDDDTLDIEWKFSQWTGKFDEVRQEFIRIILDIMSDDDSISLPALAWSNHLEHTGGLLLKDHGNWIGLEPDDINTVSQKSLGVVFPDTFN